MTSIQSPASVTASRSDLRLLARTGLQYLPSRIVPALVGAAALPALGWLLAPGEFGVLALVTAALPFVSLVGDWVVSGYQRHAAGPGGEVEGQAFAWVVVLGGGAATALVAVGALSGDASVVAIGLLVLPYLVNRMQWTKLQMAGQAAGYSVLQTTYTAARAASMVAAAALTHRASAAMAAWILTSVGIAIAGPRLRIARVPRRAALAGLAAIGVPLVIAALAMNTAAVADRFVVAALDGKAAAGVYAFGCMVTEGAIALPISVALLANYRLVMRAWDEGRVEAALGLVATVLRVQVALVLVSALVAGLLGPLVLRLVAPPAYFAAAPVLGLVAVGQVPAGAVPYLLLLATVRQRTRRAVLPSAIAAVANVAFTVPAVWLAGPVGAAAATVATYLLYAAVLARAVLPSVRAGAAAGTLLLAVAAAGGAALARGPVPIVALGVVTVVCGFRALTGARWSDLVRSAA